MHICFVTNEYPKQGFPHGGIGTFIKTIGRALVKEGHKVTVVGINYISSSEHINDNGVNVYRVKRSKVKVLGVLFNHFRMNKMIKEINTKEPIDIIESNENGLALLKRIKSIKHVIRMHGGHHFFTIYEKRPRESKKVWLEKRSFNKADHFIAVSKFVSEITLRELNLDRKVEVIYNPIDVERFAPTNSYKVKPESILFVGTVCEKKGVRQLVEALPIVKEKLPNVTLKVVGRDWLFTNGDSYIEFLKKNIPEKIKDCIEFVGLVPNEAIPKLIEESELSVFPSHMEAMPLSWLEVLSMGKPFVGSNIGPGVEAVKDGQTGLLCDPHNPKDIADKIFLQLTNKEKALEMGQLARLDMELRFDINTIVKKNIDFFKSII